MTLGHFTVHFYISKQSQAQIFIYLGFIIIQFYYFIYVFSELYSTDILVPSLCFHPLA
jgi:hypothetical protein